MKPGAMVMKRRTRGILWGIMAIVLITAGLALYHPHHEPIARMALPDGTELRLEYVTYGTEHRAPGAGKVVVWAAHFAQRWPRWGIPEHTEEYRYESGEPMLYLWFTHLDRRAGKFLPDVDKGLSVEPAGDSEVSIFAVNHQFSAHNYDAYFENLSPMPHVIMGVNWYDRRKATLRLRVTMQGQTSELEVPNPAAKLSFPEWDPAPLPQTRRVGVLDVVLRSIQVSEDRVQTLSKETGQWEYVRSVDPEFEILRNGQKAEGLDIYQEHFMDPTGNRGMDSVLLSFAERAWKVRATVLRNDLYPIAEEEGLTLGPVPLPEAGKYSVFPVPAEETKEGLGLVVLVGPGRYIWRDGVFEEIAEALSDRDEAAAFLYRERTPPSLRINATSPTLVFLFRAAEGAHEKKWTRGYDKVVRVKWNEPVFGAWEIENNAVGEDFHESGLARPIAYRLPGTDEEKKRSLPGTPVTVQIVPDEEEILEFFVAPPKVPEKAKETPE